MPSPIGHAIAGAAIAWAAEAVHSESTKSERTPWTLTIVAAAVAMAPDLDLLAPYQHRTITHSVLAVAVVAIIASVVTGQVTRLRRARRPAEAFALQRRWAIVGVIIAAYASHLLLDWLAEDDTVPRGIQFLWPFGHQWFISGADLFRGTARRDLFTVNSMRVNALAVAQEMAILGPVAVAAWLVRVKALARLPAEVPRRHHAAQ